MSNRTAFFSNMNKNVSKKLNQGCPQRGALSPFLWNLLKNDLEHFNTQIVGHADDISIICWPIIYHCKQGNKTVDLLANHAKL